MKARPVCAPLVRARAATSGSLDLRWTGQRSFRIVRPSFGTRSPMAQLSNDCFQTGDELLPLVEAVRLIGERVTVAAGIETVPLACADNRVLARAVAAPVDLPGFDNSAVDGYAVRFADLAVAGETRLPVTGRIAAGRSAEIEAGGAIRIFTGAAMPEGYDTVFMQEDARTDGPDVILPAGLAKG